MLLWVRKGMINLEYVAFAETDIGAAKEVNQDSFGVKIVETRLGKMAFAILCDGMGGLSSGEIASAAVVREFENWVVQRLPELCDNELTAKILQQEWTELLEKCNFWIGIYGKDKGITLGTTAAILLVTESYFFCMHIGDTRIYMIDSQVKQLTRDHTVVVREAEMGLITEEQARNDPRRCVLLQCIGASQVIEPSFLIGETEKNAVYMLCTDGFWHEITEAEMQQYFDPSVTNEPKQIGQNVRRMIEWNKQRQERDNITVAVIRTRA